MEEKANADKRMLMTVSRNKMEMSMRLISGLGKKYVYFNQTELDSHANMCVCGKNCVMLEDSGVSVNVSPFMKKYSSIKDVPMDMYATSLELDNGDVLVLIIHQALFFGGRLPFTLLNPNQLCDNGITVEDVPCQFKENSRHAIIVPPAGGEELVIPIQLNGSISGRGWEICVLSLQLYERTCGGTAWGSASAWPSVPDSWLDWLPEYDYPLGEPTGLATSEPSSTIKAMI